MRELGAVVPRIRAKIVGGASMFGNVLVSNGVNIGERNVIATRDALAVAQVPIIAEDTGSNYGRSVYLFIEDGRVEVAAAARRLACPLAMGSQEYWWSTTVRSCAC